MQVADLLEILEDLDPDTEIRIASQPQWPFEYSLADAVEVYPDDDPDNDTVFAEGESVLYLVEGRQLGYLPGVVKGEIGW